MQTWERLLVMIFWFPIVLFYYSFKLSDENQFLHNLWHSPTLPYALMGASFIPVLALLRTLLITSFAEVYESIIQENQADESDVGEAPTRIKVQSTQKIEKPKIPQKREVVFLEQPLQETQVKVEKTIPQQKPLVKKKFAADDLLEEWEQKYMGTYKNPKAEFATKVSEIDPENINLRIAEERKSNDTMVQDWESQYFGQYEKVPYEKDSQVNKQRPAQVKQAPEIPVQEKPVEQSVPSMFNKKSDKKNLTENIPKSVKTTTQFSSIQEWESAYFGQYEKNPYEKDPYVNKQRTIEQIPQKSEAEQENQQNKSQASKDDSIVIPQKQDQPQLLETSFQKQTDIKERIVQEQLEYEEWRRSKQQLEINEEPEMNHNQDKIETPKKQSQDPQVQTNDEVNNTVERREEVKEITREETNQDKPVPEARLDHSFRSQISSSFQVPTHQFNTRQSLVSAKENLMSENDRDELREFQHFLIEQINQKFDGLHQKLNESEAQRLTPRSRLSDQDRDELREFEKNILEKIDQRLEEFSTYSYVDRVQQYTPSTVKGHQRYFVSQNREVQMQNIPRLQLDRLKTLKHDENMTTTIKSAYFGQYPQIETSYMPSQNISERDIYGPQTSRSESYSFNASDIVLSLAKRPLPRNIHHDSQNSTAINTPRQPSLEGSVDQRNFRKEIMIQDGTELIELVERVPNKKKQKWRPKTHRV